MNKESAFRYQRWDGSKKTEEIENLSYEAARELAIINSKISTAEFRIMSQTEDYCEVWTHSGYRQGTFAETTFVKYCEELK